MYLFDQKTVFLSQPRLRVSIISGVGDKYQVPFFIRPMAAHFRHHHRVLSSTLSPRWNAIYEDKQRHLGESNGSLTSAASMKKPTGRRRVVVQSETNKTRRSDTMRNNCPAVVSNVRAVTFLIDTASRDRCHFLLSPASDEIKKTNQQNEHATPPGPPPPFRLLDAPKIWWSCIEFYIQGKPIFIFPSEKKTRFFHLDECSWSLLYFV